MSWERIVTFDPKNLYDRLLTHSFYVKLHGSEREFLAELIREHFTRRRSRREMAEEKAVAVAHHVIWLVNFTV